MLLVNWFIFQCSSSNKQLYLATDPVFKWTAGFSFYCQIRACGIVELHPSVDYLFPNPELWKCWTFYRAWHSFVILFYFNPYRNINELGKILPFFHLQNLMSEGLKEGLLSILCWNNILSQTPYNICFLSFAGSSSTVRKIVSGLDETIFRITVSFPLLR